MRLRRSHILLESYQCYEGIRPRPGSHVYIQCSLSNNMSSLRDESFWYGDRGKSFISDPLPSARLMRLNDFPFAMDFFIHKRPVEVSCEFAAIVQVNL